MISSTYDIKCSKKRKKKRIATFLLGFLLGVPTLAALAAADRLKLGGDKMFTHIVKELAVVLEEVTV